MTTPPSKKMREELPPPSKKMRGGLPPLRDISEREFGRVKTVHPPESVEDWPPLSRVIHTSRNPLA